MSRVPEEDVHTTVRQRMRAARRAEGKALYEEVQQKLFTTTEAKRQTTNHLGQAMDHQETAISRLVKGEFYSCRGTGVGEIGERRPVSRDVRHPAVKEAGTETEPAPCGRNAHQDGRQRHHCHHGHRKKDAGVETDDVIYPVTASSAPRSRPASTYAHATLSSQRKVYERPIPEEGYLEMPPSHPPRALQSARGTRSASSTLRTDPYESVLKAVTSKHSPGEADVISKDELERLKRIATVPRRPLSSKQSQQQNKKPDTKQIFY